MANIFDRIIGEAKKKRNELEQRVTNNAVTRGVSRSVDQINPLDNGRTWKQTAPVATKQGSAFRQATHSGASNMVGGIAKPLIRNSMALNNGIGNAQVNLAHSLGLRKDLKTTNTNQYINNSIGRNANRAIDYTGTKRQITGDAISNVANVGFLGSSKLVAGAVSKVIPKTAPSVVKKFTPQAVQKNAPQVIQKYVPKVVAGAPVGAASGALGNIGGYVASDQKLTAQGFRDNAVTGAKYGAAFGAAAPVAIPLAKVAGKTTVKGAKAANTRIEAANRTKVSAMNDDRTLSILAKQDKILAQRQSQLDPLDSRGWDLLQRKRDAGAYQAKQIQANATKRSIGDKILAPDIGMTVGGPNALQYMYAKKHGQVFDGVDGKPRFEIDDSKSKLTDIGTNGFQRARLSQVLEHPQLFKNYPELQNMDVTYKYALEDTATVGQFDGREISLNPRIMNNPEKVRSTLLHELQHAIQGKEKFARGGGKDTVPRNELMQKKKVIDDELASLKESADYLNAKVNDAWAANDADTIEQYLNHPTFKRQSELVRESQKLGEMISNPRKAYELLGGEAEARAVQARADLPMSKRYVSEEPKQGYRSTHQIDDNIPVHKADLAALKERVKQLDGYIGNSAASDLRKLEKIVKDPEADVKIYRAAPVNELNQGDWVTTSREYANDIKRQNGGKVNVFTVKAKELHLPKNIEDNPSLARFAAFQYKAADTPNTPDTKSLKREIAELDRKINAFEGNSPAKQQLIDRQIRAVEELEGGKPEALDIKGLEEYIKKHGEPVYHGTNATFDKFDSKRINTVEGSGDYAGAGFYFTGNKDRALRYAGQAVKKNGGQEQVIEAYLKLKNPLVIASDKQGQALRDSFGGDEAYFDLIDENPKLIQQELIKRGYDGVIDKTYNQTAVFDASQIKTRKQLEAEYKQQSAPSPAKRSTFYDSLDVPKDELIIRNGDGGTAMSIDKRAYADDLTPEQNEFIASYAEMLKSMGEGNGVAVNPVTKQRLSNNYRSPDVGSERMTNTNWFDQARKDIETGKADPYAIEEYNNIGKIADEPPLDIPEGFNDIGSSTTPAAQLPSAAKPPRQPVAPVRPANSPLPIKVSQSGGQKTLPVSKVTQDGRQITKTDVGKTATAGKEKRFTLDANGEMQLDTNGAYKIFTDDDGKVTSFRVGDEVFDAKDLGGLDDVNGYGSVYATMRRNVERSFGGKSADKVGRFLVDHQQGQATKLIDRRVQLNKGLQEQADNLGISFGIGKGKAKKVSAAIQDFGEGKIDRAQLVEQFGAKQATNIVNADKWFRAQYDGLLDEMNTTLVKYGYKAVPKRKDYYTHFSEPGLWEKFGLRMQELRDIASPTMQDADPTQARGSISNKLAGQSENLLPNKQFNPFALRRKGDTRTADAFQSFERYLTPTLSNIYMTPSITRARVLSKAIAENAVIDGRDINKTVVQLREWANSLAGKSNRMGDRQLSDTMNGQKVLKVLQFAQKRAGANTIVGNLATAALQPIVGAQTVGKFGLKNFLLAATQEIGTAHASKAAIRQSEFMRRRYTNIRRVTAGKVERGADIANTPLRVVEQTVARITWNASHNKALSSGLKGKEAIRAADIETEKTIAGRSIGERPEIFNSKAMGPLTMYQLEVNNFWQQIGREMTPKQKVSTLVAVYAFNLALQQVTGREVGFNPIDTAIDSYKDFQDDEKSVGAKIGDTAKRFTGEVVDNTPIIGPVANAALGDKKFRGLLGDDSNTGRFGVASPISAITSTTKIPGVPTGVPLNAILPFGGSQVKKIIEGGTAWAQGGVTDKNGKKVADVPQTVGNGLRATLFGKQAVPEVKQYYEGIGKKKIATDKTPITEDSKAMALTFGKDFAALKNDTERKDWARQSDDNRAIYDNYQAMKTGMKQSTDLRPSGMAKENVKVLDKFDRLTPAAKDKLYSRDKTAEYQYELAKLEQDELSGKLSTTERIRRQQEVAKAKVGTAYDKEVRDLYGLSKSQLYTYLSTHDNGNDLAEKVVAYGDALEANELGENKFRSSKGYVSIRPTAKGGGSRSSGYKLKPSDFKTPFDNLIQSSTKGANLARNAKLARKRA